MRLVPKSGQPTSSDGYGYSNDAYAAQTMFRDYREGMGVGTLGAVTDINAENDETFNPFAAEEVGSLFAEPVVAGHSKATSMNNPNQGRGQVDQRSTLQAPVARVRRNSEWGAVISAAAEIAVAGIGLGFQSAATKKASEQELAMMTEQQKLTALQAQAAAAQAELASASATSPWVWIMGGVVILGVVGAVVYNKQGSHSKRSHDV